MFLIPSPALDGCNCTICFIVTLRRTNNFASCTVYRLALNKSSTKFQAAAAAAATLVHSLVRASATSGQFQDHLLPGLPPNVWLPTLGYTGYTSKPRWVLGPHTSFSSLIKGFYIDVSRRRTCSIPSHDEVPVRVNCVVRTPTQCLVNLRHRDSTATIAMPACLPGVIRFSYASAQAKPDGSL